MVTVGRTTGRWLQPHGVGNTSVVWLEQSRVDESRLHTVYGERIAAGTVKLASRRVPPRRRGSVGAFGRHRSWCWRSGGA